MTPVDPSGGSCSSRAAAAGVELPLAPATTSKGESSSPVAAPGIELPLAPMTTSKGECSSPATAAGVDLPVAPTTSSKGEDEESMWESDWVSGWESDWASGDEKDPFVKKVAVMRSDDSEPKIKRLKSMETLTGDGGIPPTIKTQSRESIPTSDEEDIVEVDDDSTDDSIYSETSSEDFNSEEEAALTPGMACHYCMQRNAKQKMQCSRCPLRFCGLCLQNRNGEQLEVGKEGVKWVCPRCRGGCGPGCICCCTCAKCRKSRGLRPTGQVLRLAKAAGFDNVHDYLVHRETGESPEKIAKRKDGKCWRNTGGAMITRSAGKTVGTLKAAQFWADCVPTNQDPLKKIAKRKKPGVGPTKARAAMFSCSRLQKAPKLKPPEFWADCPTNRAAIECDNGQTPERIPTKREGRGGIKATGGYICSCSTGATVGMLKPAQFRPDYAPANPATVAFNNEQTRQKNGLQSWTVPKAVGDLWKSTDENAKRGNGERGAVVPPSGDSMKNVDVFKRSSDELEKAVNEKRSVLDQILGRKAQKQQKPLRIKVSLDQILNRLLDGADQAGRDRSGPLFGGIQRKRRNRKHRKMGRILEPSMFKIRRSKKRNPTKIDKATLALPPPVEMEDAHRDLSSRAADNTPPEKKPIAQPAAPSAQQAQDARRLHQDRSWSLPFPLKRPVTSLQALRKMGIFPQRKGAEISAAQRSESARKSEELPTSRPLVGKSLDQKQSSHGVSTASPFSPSGFPLANRWIKA